MTHKICQNQVAVQVPNHPGTRKPYYQQNERPSRTHQRRLIEVQAFNEQHRNSFFVESIRLYNNMPSEIIEAPSIDAFKSRLVRHTLSDVP